MKHKGLFLLIALALGGVGAVHAGDAQDSMNSPQDSSTSMDSMSSGSYDTRWYIAPTLGGYYNDTDRNTNSRQIYYGLGFGRFVSPNASIDFFYDGTRRNSDFGGHWTSDNFGVAARFYGGGWNAWRPYGLVGVMASNHDAPFKHNGWSPAAELGFGLSKTVTDSIDFRVETGYRYDWDNNSQPSKGGYGDWFLGLSLAFRLGPPPAPPAPPVAPPPPPPPSCDQLDDDHDNVNNCDDKCPGTPAGTIVDQTGCPQKVVIDLRGVNFKFDRPSKGETDIAPTLQVPTADSMAVLDQAVDTLQRYPQVKVEVAGYTDSIGSDEYNQGLSERRAKIVYDYLTAHGIDASRLEGPTGHGENDPVDTNDTKEGRARNRRTELQVDQSSQ